MVPNIIQKLNDLTRIPTNTNVSTSNGTGSPAREKADGIEHHEDAKAGGTYPESPFPAGYVEYHYTRYPNRWSRIRYV